MTRLWKSSVAMLLELVSFVPAFAQEPVQQQPPLRSIPPFVGRENVRQPNPNGATDKRLFNNNLPANAANQIAAGDLLNQQQQPAQSNPVPPPRDQGVNAVPGQSRLADQPQRPNNLGNNQQGQPFVNPNNLLDQWGAPIRQPQNELAQRNQLIRQRAQALREQLNGSQQGGVSTNPQLIEQALASGGYGGGPAYFGGVGGTSTIEESVLTGQARAYQGAGEYNRNSAEAVKTLELAKAIALENARTGLKTYFELKEINANYRAKHMPEPLTKEKLDEWNRQDQPERLTRAQYNTDTGSLRWPTLLQTQAFDDQRILLEELFARRSADEFGTDSEFYRQVAASSQVIKDRLKDYLRSGVKFFSDEEYVTAQNFMDSLTHEARLAPDIEGLAAN